MEDLSLFCCRGSEFCFVVEDLSLFSSFAIILMRERERERERERAGCFTIIVFLVSCDC